MAIIVCSMTLAEYLETHGISQIEFLCALNAARPPGTAKVWPAAMSNYANDRPAKGEDHLRTPADSLKARIHDLTGGLVDGNSWVIRARNALPQSNIGKSAEDINNNNNGDLA